MFIGREKTNRRPATSKFRVVASPGTTGSQNEPNPAGQRVQGAGFAPVVRTSWRAAGVLPDAIRTRLCRGSGGRDDHGIPGRASPQNWPECPVGKRCSSRTLKSVALFNPPRIASVGGLLDVAKIHPGFGENRCPSHLPFCRPKLANFRSDVVADAQARIRQQRNPPVASQLGSSIPNGSKSRGRRYSSFSSGWRAGPMPTT